MARGRTGIPLFGPPNYGTPLTDGPNVGNTSIPWWQFWNQVFLSSVSKFTQSWVNQMAVSVQHNLGTTAVVVQVYDSVGNLVIPPDVTIQVMSTNLVNLAFSVPLSGSVVVVG